MKYLFYLICLLTSSFSLGINAANQPTFKQRLIECINKGYYPRASNILPLVDEWTYNDADSIVHINVDKGMDFLEFTNTIQVDTNLVDSFAVYFAEENRSQGYSYFRKHDLNNAVSFYLIAIKIFEQVSLLHIPNYATSLDNLGGLYHQMGD